MRDLSKKLIDLSMEALKAENDELADSLNGNKCYPSSNNGLLSINNERYYQFVIAKYLFKHLPYKIALEDYYTDLVVYPKDSDYAYKYNVAIEMKRWMSSKGEKEIPQIRKDFEKLSKIDAKSGLIMIFSSNPSYVSIEKNIDILSQDLNLNLDREKWYYREFDTIGKEGVKNVFWVAGYEVSR